MTASTPPSAPRTGRSMTPRIGVRDVARHAGVSAQTVSRVLNDHPSIAPQTRERVEAAIAALDYRPNNAARALWTSSSRTIGILASDARLAGPTSAIVALEAAARARGRWVSTAYADAADAGAVRAAASHLRDQGVDGVVIVGAHASSVEATSGIDVPVVVMHDRAEGMAPQSASAALVAERLVAGGHTRIAELRGPAPWIESRLRSGGFRAALATHALAPSHVFDGDWSAAAGAAVADPLERVLRSDDPPTAIFVANDQMALGLMTALQDAGVRIPDDLSVVGFDDNPDAAYYRPALSTVRLDVGAEAVFAIAAVLGEAASSVPAGVLVERASSRPTG